MKRPDMRDWTGAAYKLVAYRARNSRAYEAVFKAPCRPQPHGCPARPGHRAPVSSNYAGSTEVDMTASACLAASRIQALTAIGDRCALPPPACASDLPLERIKLPPGFEIERLRRGAGRPVARLGEKARSSSAPSSTGSVYAMVPRAGAASRKCSRSPTG